MNNFLIDEFSPKEVDSIQNYEFLLSKTELSFEKHKSILNVLNSYVDIKPKNNFPVLRMVVMNYWSGDQQTFYLNKLLDLVVNKTKKYLDENQKL